MTRHSVDEPLAQRSSNRNELRKLNPDLKFDKSSPYDREKQKIDKNHQP
jgi:hypothetical protein